VNPPGLPDLSAKTCGACHTEIYEEWKLSVHAAAWTDRQAQAEFAKGPQKWMCLNCHTPLRIQQENWPVGLVDDDVQQPILVKAPVYDAALREEGITCAACHVRDGVIHGPGLEDSVAPHPVEADPTFRDEQVCLRCHQAVATYPGKDFTCTFNTGVEWQAGPDAAEGTHCADCHMPRIDRPAAIGGPTRSVARHWWRGAGIPKEAGVHPPPEANKFGLDLQATAGGGAVELVLTNAHAGHMLPTGDPERWVEVTVTFSGADGAMVGEPAVTRIGQTWEWYPAPKKIGDNRLSPREERRVSIPVPDGAASAEIVASNHRISKKNADYHHLDGYPRSVEVSRMTLSELE
jgi:hypothetical protein